MSPSERQSRAEIPVPKTGPLPGYICMEYRRCGRANCRCSTGQLHGPYYVRRWWEAGRQRKAYVRRSSLVEMLLATAEYRAMKVPVSRILASLRATRSAIG